MEPFSSLDRANAERCVVLRDRATGLQAVVVLDDLTLGPGAGGVRTRAYPDFGAAVADAQRLARAMTLKCALAGLAAGGAKAVVIDHDGMDRERAFEALGRHVEALGGLFRTAGDYGTTERDLAAMARHTRYVHQDGGGRLTGAVARGLLRCVEACASMGQRTPSELRIAVQGCGAIGRAVAGALADAGMKLVVTDTDAGRAEEVARAVGAETAAPSSFWDLDVDVLAPCATGAGITANVAETVRAWAICGAANNQLADAAAGDVLHRRGVLFVPDTVASAGAVIDGIGRSVMALKDPSPLVDRLGETARAILRRSAERDRPPTAVAEALALERIGGEGGT